MITNDPYTSGHYEVTTDPDGESCGRVVCGIVRHSEEGDNVNDKNRKIAAAKAPGA
jgi:hypothetical protein